MPGRSAQARTLGAGVDVAAIRQRAMAMGLPDPSADLNDEQVLDLVFDLVFLAVSVRRVGLGVRLNLGSGSVHRGGRNGARGRQRMDHFQDRLHTTF